jgi:hypothetical protein
MQVSLNIPDGFAATLADELRPTLARTILEGFAAHGYRQGMLSAAQVGALLGLENRWDTEDFLSFHAAWPDPTAAEVSAGAGVLRSIRRS